jgi:hypothetical protein
VAGGIAAIARHLLRQSGPAAIVFLTGGDAGPIGRLLTAWAQNDPSLPAPILWPEQTLEGIHRVAEALP